MPPDEAQRRSAAITRRLVKLSAVQQAPVILCYVSSKDNEVDTLNFIRMLLDDQRTVLVPVMQPGNELRWSRVYSLDEVHPERFGILEPPPESCAFLEPPQNSVCIVPGIAFSSQGHRIGYGGGYFDRFLSVYDKIYSIGLAYDDQTSAIWPVEATDIPVDLVVTETTLYNCKIMKRDK